MKVKRAVRNALCCLFRLIRRRSIRKSRICSELHGVENWKPIRREFGVSNDDRKTFKLIWNKQDRTLHVSAFLLYLSLAVLTITLLHCPIKPMKDSARLHLHMVFCNSHHWKTGLLIIKPQTVIDHSYLFICLRFLGAESAIRIMLIKPENWENPAYQL